MTMEVGKLKQTNNNGYNGWTMEALITMITMTMVSQQQWK